ncbi:MAG TPA: DUF998 domain-containing protein [Polyangia bacterium]
MRSERAPGARQAAGERDTSSTDGLVISYLTLRKALGVLGIALPLVLAAGDWIIGDGRGLQPTISDYYGTGMRDVFVGLLFAMGLFFFSYRGFDWRDELAGKLACLFAIGVALFPTTSALRWVHVVHFAAAAALFLTLAVFSLCLFTRMAAGSQPTPQKLKRNRVYRACGIIILTCVAAIALGGALLDEALLAELKPIFWLETVALWAFGFSWLTKGEFLLQD